MWEERFATPDYVYGTAPAQGLVRLARWLPASGRVLSVAEGEGRNAVFMAERGLTVTALESAPSALAKARALADAHGVVVEFRADDVLTRDWEDAAFDAVAGIFIQFVGEEARARLFAGMARALRPGGAIVLHGYTLAQLAFGTGGPKAVENLYTPALLRGHFPGWPVLACETYEAVLEEGTGHSGRSALIDFAATKP